MWRIRRIESIESALMDMEIAKNGDTFRQAYPESTDRTMEAAALVANCTTREAAILMLDRHETRLHRQFLLALRQLELSRRTQAAAPQPAQPAIQPQPEPIAPPFQPSATPHPSRIPTRPRRGKSAKRTQRTTNR